MGRKPVDELDWHIGKRLRALRLTHRMSLETVGEIINVSQQQVSRYELGQHRLSAAQLYRLARGLDVPISWFFREYKEADAEFTRLQLVVKEDRGRWQVESDEEKERALLLAWRKLPNNRQRDVIVNMIEVFSMSID